MDEEGAFPRGGASSITPLKRRQIRQEAQAEAERDFFADAAAGATEGRKRQKKGKPINASQALDDQLLRRIRQDRLPAFVELLKFKTCMVGAKVWGAVSDVLPHGLTVSLPDGLKGYVKTEEASDMLAKLHAQTQPLPRLTDLFSTGQLVRCTVTGLEQQAKAQTLNSKSSKNSKKSVHLSLAVSKVNAGLSAETLQEGHALPACVTSIEDHGYSLTFGIKGVSGFLPKKVHAKAYGSASVLKPGMLAECVVASAGNKRLVKVTTDPEALSRAVLKDFEGLHIGALMPGALVAAKVEKILSDGLSLSFLSFFTGTVDQFHLAEACPKADWSKKYSEQQQVQARILYVDPTSKRIMLSLQSDLTSMSTRSLPSIGEVFEDVKVTRIDEGLGLVLELPTEPALTPGFVHISNAGDTKIDKLQQAYKVGQKVKGRVIGARQLDGLSVLSLKPLVVEQQVASIAAVVPGSMMTGTIHSIADYGMLVSLAPGIRALVPSMHTANVSSKRGPPKYIEGQQVTGRIVEVDAAKKRVIMSLKKLLCSDKLPTITSFQDAAPGTASHGYITGVKPYGLFISFCGGIKGLAHTAELPLAPDQKPADAYKVGQVIKCRVLSTDLSHQRLKLSLMGKKSNADGSAAEGSASGDPLGGLQPGDVVPGTVREVETVQEEGEAVPKLYTVELQGGAHGHLEAGHLADHPSAVAALQAVAKPGLPLGPLLVLERLEATGVVKLTRKASLIAAASALPNSVSDLKETQLVPGYIASVTGDACYVRFLNQLTGRAGLAQLADLFVSDPSRHFHVNQSVKAQVVQVDTEKERFSVTLKHSLVGGSDAAYLQSLFQDLEFAEKLRAASEADESNTVQWEKDFAVGAVVDVSVHEKKDYGLVFDFPAHADVLGLAAKHQGEGPEPSPGTDLKARILDVSKDTGIVDVSLKPTLISASAVAHKASQPSSTAAPAAKAGKKRKAEEILDATHAAGSQLKVGKEQLTATVELVKDDYVVLSLPKHGHALGFAAVHDFNLQSLEGRSPFRQGQVVQAKVGALPGQVTGGRLVMHVPLLTDAQAVKKSSSKGMAMTPGQLMPVKVTAVCPAWLDVTVQAGVKGRICISEIQDAEQTLADNSNPMQPFAIGQTLEAVHLGYMEGYHGRRLGVLDLSIRPAVVTAARKDGNIAPVKRRASKMKPGQIVCGYVQEIADDHIIVQLASIVKGRVSIFDSAEEPQALKGFAELFKEGQAIKCRISQMDKNKGQADLSLTQLASGSKLSSATALSAPAGTLLLGQVGSTSGGVVHVHVGRRAYGRVAMTDVHDSWVPNALEGIREGLFLRCCVLGTAPEHGKGKEGKGQGAELQLSVQPSKGGMCAGRQHGKKSNNKDKVATVSTVDQLKDGDKVQGYVKNVSAVGVFVTLSSSVEARVKLGQLSDTFIEDPKAAFPVGQLVSGRILNVQGDRVEMTLKTAGSGMMDMSQLKKGEVVRGKIKRLEAFGAFVQLDNSNLSGLAHISEISDDFVKNLQDVLQVGQGVRAKILDIDTKQHRLSLGLKASYFNGVADTDGDAVEVVSDIEEEMAELASASDSEGEDAAEEAAAVSSEEEESGDEQKATSDEEEEDALLDLDADEAASSGDEQIEEEDYDLAKGGPHPKKHKTGSQSQGLGSVGWDASDEEDEPVVSAAQVPEASAKKLTRAQKKREKEAHEEQTRQRELARVSDSASQPESAEDFERLVMGQPDNSLLWIQYMASLIALGEVDKARGIAERALASINYREEGEKFNVWQAWLNLENMYGSPTPEEAVTRIFQKALPYCNAKKLYLALLDILERTNKDEMAEQTLKAMCRKFSSSAKIWMRQITWLLSKDQPDAVKRTLDKAFNALPQRKHIKVISQTAIQEFKQGSAERGRSMFESCLRNYPARLDVWSQYLDQEIRLGEQQRIRALFERATHLHLPPKKMKFLFKRYLQYEQEHGDTAAVAHVKKQALSFVQQNMAQ